MSLLVKKLGTKTFRFTVVVKPDNSSTITFLNRKTTKNLFALKWHKLFFCTFASMASALSRITFSGLKKLQQTFLVYYPMTSGKKVSFSRFSRNPPLKYVTERSF